MIPLLVGCLVFSNLMLFYFITVQATKISRLKSELKEHDKVTICGTNNYLELCINGRYLVMKYSVGSNYWVCFINDIWKAGTIKNGDVRVIEEASKQLWSGSSIDKLTDTTDVVNVTRDKLLLDMYKSLDDAFDQELCTMYKVLKQAEHFYKIVESKENA